MPKKSVERKIAEAQAEVARLRREQEREAAAGLLEELAEIDRTVAGHDSAIARRRKERAGAMRRRRNVAERVKTARKKGLLPPESGTECPPAPVAEPARGAPPDWTVFTAPGGAAAARTSSRGRFTGSFASCSPRATCGSAMPAATMKDPLLQVPEPRRRRRPR
ncbi:MAG: hypothetical protein OXI87_04850 [Albidovulum sp.]|nr:hypothetical protein [Albidovulum sp.]